MSQVTFHQRPDGIFIEIPEDVTDIRDVTSGELKNMLVALFADRRSAALQEMPLPDLLGEIVKTWADSIGGVLPPDIEELKRRVDGFSAHDRIRLGAVK